MVVGSSRLTQEEQEQLFLVAVEFKLIFAVPWKNKQDPTHYYYWRSQATSLLNAILQTKEIPERNVSQRCDPMF